ncbi:MAG: hypothetical protein B7Y12_02675 [Rhizobiales bacterium 24-66-13]|jgi:hypothetical protein|nr:MAG: hypothetical protein B7Y12_02675 [Rhizobiales bacterium 24-66-13]OZB11958.1 MAG: hypothetical protein B7X67_01440 [Rhizobiales bacterium 39-66-18]
MMSCHWEKDGLGSTPGPGSLPFPPLAVSGWAPTFQHRERIVTRMNVREAAARVKVGKTALYAALRQEKVIAGDPKAKWQRNASRTDDVSV